MAAKTWTCSRQSGGIKCRHQNPKRKQICERCGKKRPATKKPEHAQALKQPYEVFVLANGGSENCGICGTAPTPVRKNDRDHEHRDDGLVRGILCHSCNRTLGPRMEASARQGGMTLSEWLRAATDYVERAERLRGIDLTKLL